MLGAMSQVAARRTSYPDYLAMEAGSLDKHEFGDGMVIAMAGGTLSHSLLKTNLTVAVGSALRGRPCRPFDADLRVRVPATTLATYPDLTVICGPPERDAEDHEAAVNPTALFKVLSKSTAGYDRGEKFDHYQQLPSLQQYVLIDYTRPHVDVYTRLPSGGWERRGYGEDQRVPLPSIDVELSVAEIYSGWAEVRDEESAKA